MKMNYEELKTANATPAAASMVETFRAMGYSIVWKQQWLIY